jgi:hypothetical protein
MPARKSLTGNKLNKAEPMPDRQLVAIKILEESKDSSAAKMLKMDAERPIYMDWKGKNEAYPMH